jgi:ribosomal protein L7/L12
MDTDIAENQVKVEFKVTDATGTRTITFSKVVPIVEIISFFNDAGLACDKIYSISSTSAVDVSLAQTAQHAVSVIRAICVCLRVPLKEAKDAYDYWLASGKPFFQTTDRDEVNRVFSHEGLVVKFTSLSGKAYFLENGQINPHRG